MLLSPSGQLLWRAAHGEGCGFTVSRLWCVPPSILLCFWYNLGFLGYFKYFDFYGPTGEIVRQADHGPRTCFCPLAYPLYLSDDFLCHRCIQGDISAESRLSPPGAVYFIFPKNDSGPVRYGGFDACIHDRRVTPETFAYGARCFIYGLSRNLFLQTSSEVWWIVLSHPMEQVRLGWYIGILYTLQIYFDFQGIPIWRWGWGKCLALICRRISITRIWRGMWEILAQVAHFLSSWLRTTCIFR